jgi:hypothetical protein
MTPVEMPTKPQTRGELGITPMNARIFLLSVPKVGKTTLASSWAPAKTLFIDTQHGTDMLDGEHYVIHVSTWTEFVQAVALVLKGGHGFETVVVDTIDDVYKLCDAHVAQSKGMVAAGLIDFGRGTAEAEGLFRREVGALMATTLGVWFVGHADLVDVNKMQKYVPVLDKKVRNYITGACGFIFYAERVGTKRVLHTQPSERFEAGSRVPLPEPLDMDAKRLWSAMDRGLNPEKYAKKAAAKTPEPTPKPEAVPA